jgi:hypothetical protein
MTNIDSCMSLSESAGVYATHSLFKEKPDWSALLAQLADEYGSSASGSDLLRAIHNSGRDTILTIYDAHAIARVITDIARRRILVYRIPLEGRASSNRQVNRNQEILDCLPSGFEASFDGRSADADGVFIWTAKLECGSSSIAAPGAVPLEVGTTNAWTTWEHIIFHGGVARLPYASDSLFLFICTSIRPDLSL